MPLREEQCGSHNEDLCVCVPTVHVEHTASKDVCICVRQTHGLYVYKCAYTLIHIIQIITKQTKLLTFLPDKSNLRKDLF